MCMVSDWPLIVAVMYSPSRQRVMATLLRIGPWSRKDGKEARTIPSGYMRSCSDKAPRKRAMRMDEGQVTEFSLSRALVIVLHIFFGDHESAASWVRQIEVLLPSSSVVATFNGNWRTVILLHGRAILAVHMNFNSCGHDNSPSVENSLRGLPAVRDFRFLRSLLNQYATQHINQCYALHQVLAPSSSTPRKARPAHHQLRGDTEF